MVGRRPPSLLIGKLLECLQWQAPSVSGSSNHLEDQRILPGWDFSETGIPTLYHKALLDYGNRVGLILGT